MTYILIMTAVILSLILLIELFDKKREKRVLLQVVVLILFIMNMMYFILPISIKAKHVNEYNIVFDIDGMNYTLDNDDVNSLAEEMVGIKMHRNLVHHYTIDQGCFLQLRKKGLFYGHIYIEEDRGYYTYGEQVYYFTVSEDLIELVHQMKTQNE